MGASQQASQLLFLLACQPHPLLTSRSHGVKSPGTRDVIVNLVCARTSVLAMVHANSMTTANATLALMVRRNGLELIAHFAHAPRTMLGLDLLSMLTIFTLGWSARIKEPATVPLENASALLDTRELPASVLLALITAMTVALAGPRSTLPPRLAECTLSLGMPRNMWDVCVMLDTVDLRAIF